MEMVADQNTLRADIQLLNDDVEVFAGLGDIKQVQQDKLNYNLP